MILVDNISGSVSENMVIYPIQVRFPDYDNQGIINNAYISMFIENACIKLFGANNLPIDFFSKYLVNYQITFHKGISYKPDENSSFFHPDAPICQASWKVFNSNIGIIDIKIFDREDSIIFVTAVLLFDFTEKSCQLPTINSPSKTSVYKYNIQTRNSDYNHSGYMNLSSIATFLESTHLSFFGDGYLKTNWIRRPLPIIVKNINLSFIGTFNFPIESNAELRVADPEGKSSVKFWIDLLDKQNPQKILVRAHLTAVYCHPDPVDWSSAHTAVIPENVRDRIRSFYFGKGYPNEYAPAN